MEEFKKLIKLVLTEFIGLPTRVTGRAFVLQIMNLKIPQYSHNLSTEYVLTFLEE